MTRRKTKHPVGKWIAIAEQNPPEFTHLVFGHWSETPKRKLPFWNKSLHRDSKSTHWAAMGVPPYRLTDATPKRPV